MNTKAILICCDSFNISTQEYESVSDAIQEMQTQYERRKPTNLEEEWEDMSYCGETDAILYANGENVYTWKVHVLKGE